MIPIPVLSPPPCLRSLRARVDGLWHRAEWIREAAGLEHIEPVTLPLRSMEQVFGYYSAGHADELSGIDHARLALACLTNYREVGEGRSQPKYNRLLVVHVDNEGFVRTLAERAATSPLLKLLLQTLVFGEGQRRSPHDTLLRTLRSVFEGRPDEEGFVGDLVDACSDRSAYVRRLAEQSVTKCRRPEQLWTERGFIDDAYAWRVFLDPVYDAVLEHVLANARELGPRRVKYGLRIALDFGLDLSLLIPRVQRTILAADDRVDVQQLLFEYLDEHLGNPPDWSRLPGLDLSVQKQYEKLRGLVEFRYFEMIARIIHNHFLRLHPDAEKEKARLRSRSFFWRNYGDQVEEIKIFLTAEKKRKIQQWQGDPAIALPISPQFLRKIGRCTQNTEIVCLLVGEVLFVEYFRGASNHTHVIPGGRELFRKLARTPALPGSHLDRIRRLSKWGFRHLYLWQIPVMNFLSEQCKITPRASHVWIPVKGAEFDAGRKIPRVRAMDKSSRAIRDSNYDGYRDLYAKVVLDARNGDAWNR